MIFKVPSSSSHSMISMTISVIVIKSYLGFQYINKTTCFESIRLIVVVWTHSESVKSEALWRVGGHACSGRHGKTQLHLPLALCCPSVVWRLHLNISSGLWGHSLVASGLQLPCSWRDECPRIPSLALFSLLVATHVLLWLRVGATDCWVQSGQDRIWWEVLSRWEGGTCHCQHNLLAGAFGGHSMPQSRCGR